MPARTATRSTRSAGTRAPRQTGIQVPDEGPATSLRAQIVHVFQDAQKTTATQRKLVVNLRKIQEACYFEPPAALQKNDNHDDFDQDDFDHELVRNVVRAMAVKKSEPAGDRVVRFLCAFLKHATDKDLRLLAPDADADAVTAPTNQLTTLVLKTVLRLFDAKDKTVRFRAVQTVTQLLNSLEQIDDDVFTLITAGLSRRLRDKEPPVRVQAALGLGRLAGEDDDDAQDDDSDDEASGSIRGKLVDVMINDPDAQVRRAILSNLPFWPATLRSQLERARDMDPATRRIVYTRILPTLGDFRYLSLVEREKLIRWGLRDRDDAVHKAAARLFRERWLEDCASKRDTRPEAERVPGSVAPVSLEALCELLERIDIVNSGDEDGMAHEAMKEFWAGRPDYREDLQFDDDFWKNIDPSAAFVVRSLKDYGQDTDDDRVRDMIEEKLPTVKAFAAILQGALNELIGHVQKGSQMDEDDPEAFEAQETVDDFAFITKQLLHICLTLDYSDEMGRRQMYNIMREAIARPLLPEDCLKLAIDVLRTVCNTESDFCAVVMEAIADVRDTLVDDDEEATLEGDDAESFHSARSETSSPPPAKKAKKAKSGTELTAQEAEDKQSRETAVYSRCLQIIQCTLQNVYCDLEKDTNLSSMLNTLIIPAIAERESMIREYGLTCLGIAALLSKDLAMNNLDLFFHCFNKGNDVLKEITLQALSDVIMHHGTLLAPPVPDPNTTDQSEIAEVNPRLKPLVRILLKALDSENPRVAFTACQAAQKLIFHNHLPPEAAIEIVRAFTLHYFDPDGVSNPAMRQALSYFLPVFCHSKLQNAQLMADVAVPVVSRLLIIRDETEEDEDAEMVGWPVITAHLSDWTDGRKVFGQTELGLDGKMSSKAASELPHINLAIDILERALTSTCSKDERKPLLSLLTKLHISPTAPKPTDGETTDNTPLETLQSLVSEAVEDKIGVDATQRNALAKLDTTLTKRLGDAAEPIAIQDDQDDQDEQDDQDNREDTVVPETAPADARASVAPSVDGSEMDVDVDEDDDEDTMLAGLQGESTRMPLDAESDSDGESTPRPAQRKGKTEADIMDELLASDDEMEL